MIRGNCFTNLDGYEHEQWPEVFCSVPCRGDKVMGEKGRVLRVCGITHFVNSDGLPEIVVELTTTAMYFNKE